MLPARIMRIRPTVMGANGGRGVGAVDGQVLGLPVQPEQFSAAGLAVGAKGSRYPATRRRAGTCCCLSSTPLRVWHWTQTESSPGFTKQSSTPTYHHISHPNPAPSSIKQCSPARSPLGLLGAAAVASLVALDMSSPIGTGGSQAFPTRAPQGARRTAAPSARPRASVPWPATAPTAAR
ncbi:hypothetical protein GGTG_12577 [Gaeumannomyces tritici R3-111a-1]|uniref:Uncharacterized protein n=1 Tax=Gaeumannomyces tritici (strain R3-111a-1) TaxID=644352 RepID=J3PGF2_GAET3|nr:hypothetical protein GGTG_12577 [Gaeumannomyces tritici R3-111a-1]EJT69694.1 hypothetical protein GGTG_12577 [Gaeumannomyces tritici R3-111a-1]